MLLASSLFPMAKTSGYDESESFSGGIVARTLKVGLVRPITRTKMFASKVMALAVYIAVFLVGLMISTILLGWFVQGGDITSDLLYTLKAYSALFIPMIAIGLISVFIA